MRKDERSGQPLLVVILSTEAPESFDALQSVRRHLGTHESWTDIVSGMPVSGTDENLNILLGGKNLRWLVPSTDVCATSGER